jgi:MscS family membrane protein
MDNIEKEVTRFFNDTLGLGLSDAAVGILLAIAIIILTLFIRRAVDAILALLANLFGRSKSTLDDRLIQAFDVPIQWLITIVGFWAALDVVSIAPEIQSISNRTFIAIVTAIIFWGVYRSIDVLIDSLETQRNRIKRLDTNVARFLRQIGRALVLIFGIVLVMEQFGYNLSTLVAGLGITGLAIALAAQDALSNLIGYFVIMADSPFQVGDHVVVKDSEGHVEGLGFRTTRIRKFDQSLVFVPNRDVASSSVINWSRLNKRRLDITVNIKRDTSPEKVLGVVNSIRATLAAHERVVPDSPVVQFVAIEGSALQIRVVAYFTISKWEAFQATQQDINLLLLKILDHYAVEFA